MKKIKPILTLLIVFFCLSCSDENESLSNSEVNYFPLDVDNSWTYENELNQASGNTQGIETLSIELENQSRYSLNQSNDQLVGIFTTMLASGEVYKQNGDQKIVLDSQFSIELENELSSLEFPLKDVVLYDANLSQGNTMSFSSGEFQHEINGIPVDFMFEINSVHQGFVLEKVVNGVNYEDVFVSEIQISLSANVFLVFNNFSILQKQEVSSITNYYAKDIGLIKSEVSTEVIFEDIPEQLNANLPDINFTSSQKLESYTLNPNS